MKTETYNLYSRDFRIFLPNIIKIDPYNFELYRFKVGPFFENSLLRTTGVTKFQRNERAKRRWGIEVRIFTELLAWFD